MRRYIRETHQILAALGFIRCDDQFSRADRTHWAHTYEPDTRITVYSHATEAACKAVQARAHQIAGLGSTETKTVRDRKQAQQKRQAAQRDRASRAEVDKRKREAAAELKHQARIAASQQASRDNEIRNLMRPGHGR